MQRRKSTKTSLPSSLKPDVEAIEVGGIFVYAVCNNNKIDIICCEDGRYLQSLDEKDAIIISWSLRTAHLAVLTTESIVLYENSLDQVSFKPIWTRQTDVLDIKASIPSFKIENIKNISFQHPYLSVVHDDTITLHNCLNHGKYHTLSSASGVPSLAKLSYSGRVLALCSSGSSRIDFMSVHRGGCSTLAHKDHSSEIKNLLWRPGYSTTRDLVLASDVTNLIRIWAVEYRSAYRGVEVHADIHLLLELGDYVGRNTLFSWVQHGLTTQAEISYLCDSLGRDVSKIGSISVSPSNASQQLHSHPSGSWLAVLDDSSIVRLWCIHAHGASNHIECTLKGHGPGLNTSTADNELQFHSFALNGRFSLLGADRPVNATVVTSYVPRGCVHPTHIDYSNQIIKIVNAESEQRLSEFVLITNKTIEFHVSNPNISPLSGDKSSAVKLTDNFSAHVPSNWRLQTWSTYQLGEGENATPQVIPKSYRSFRSPWAGTEASLWCWANRYRPLTKIKTTGISALSTLEYEPIEFASAFPGHEVSHEILKTLWLPQPFGSLLAKNAELGKFADVQEELSRNQLMISLQQPRYRSFIIAVWVSGNKGKPKETGRFATSSLAPRDDDRTISKLNFLDRSLNMRHGDTKISSQAGTGGFDSYEVSIIPDPHFGLGLRLDVNEGRILVESFKRNPLTMKPMPAEESGIIGVGDELVSVGGTNLKGHSLAEVIQTIRHVVQSERGSPISLRLRAAKHQSVDDGSMSQRTFSTTNSSRWYAEDEDIKSTTEPSLTFSAADSEGDAIDQHLNVQIPATYDWKLISSCSFDDTIAMDLTLGSAGSSLSVGNLVVTSNSLTLAVGVALRELPKASGLMRELSIFELVFRDGDISYIQRALCPWYGSAPYSLQIWCSAPNYFTICGMRVLDFPEGGITHFLTICGVEAIPNSPYFEENDLKRNQGSEPSVAGIARSISDTIGSAWSISSEITLPLSLQNSSAGLPSEDWIPLNCPFEDGSRCFLLGSPNSHLLLIIYLAGNATLSPNEVLEHYRKRRKSRSGSLSCDEEKKTQQQALGRCTQVISCEGKVKWAKFLSANNLQVAGENHVETYVMNVASGLWTKSGSTTFNGMDSPDVLTDQLLSTASPWSYGAFTNQPDFQQRGLMGNIKPDWHPLYLALELFSIGGDLRRFSRNFPLPGDLKNSTKTGEILPALYSCFCRLNLLNKALEISLGNPAAYYMTKLIGTPSTLSPQTVVDIVNLVKDTAGRILREKESFQSLVIAMKFLPGPLQLLTPDEVVTLCTQCLFLAEFVSDFGLITNCNSPDSSSQELPMFRNMDEWAIDSVISYRCINFLQQLSAPIESKTHQAIASGTVVLNALVSDSQAELYKAFIGDDVDAFTTAHESSTEISKDFHFGMLWWARNQVGKDADVEAGEYDPLRSLTLVMAPMWMRDVGPLYDLIEKISTEQFRNHRDSMKIFMEMVVVGKSLKLLQLAKTDRNIMGKQLQNLLSMDFASEKGRNAAHKNAFALLRLQRYKHAAAVFLCTEPPMLKEAVRVITKHLHDPFLALLVARLVEHRLPQRQRVGGFVLGPVSRRLLAVDILPVLHTRMKVVDGHSDSYEGKVDGPFSHWGVDAAMLALSCCLWLQDVSLFQQTVNLCSQYDIFRTNPNSSHLGYSQQLLGACGAMRWLTTQNFCPEARGEFGYALDLMCEGYKVNDVRTIGQDLSMSTTETSKENSTKSFIRFCDDAYRSWLTDVTAFNEEQKRSSVIKKSIVSNSNSDDVDDEEISKAMKKLQSLKGSADEVVFTESRPTKGFNLSMSSAPVENTSSGSMLDMFDSLPPKPKPKASEPTSMLDMFDAPPPKPKPKAPEPANMLDMFDAPPPKPKPKAPEPANMLDMFDAPPPKPKPKAPEPANMLDMFDAPPPKPKPKAPEPANMLDMFDAPPPKPKPKAPEPANMLDMFDAPPPKPKTAEVEPPSEPVPVLLSDVPDPLVTSFLSLSTSTPTLDSRPFGMELRSLILSSSTRQAIVVRSLVELQLSLGHIPTLSHPLAVSGSSRELLKVVLDDIEGSLYSDVDRLMSFRRCLRSLSLRYGNLIVLSNPPQHTISDDCRLALFLLETIEVNQPTDSLVIRILLCWAAGLSNDAIKVLISGVVSVYEIFHLSGSSGSQLDSFSNILSNASTVYLIVMLRQMQLILSLNSSPLTAKYILPESRFSAALVSLVAMTIRIALTFISLDFRYDVTQKLLRFPPRFPSAEVASKTSTSAPEKSASEYDTWLKLNPIGKSDPGHLYFRPLSRTDSIEALKGLTKGTFLLRPHENQEDVVFLSFVAGGTDVVRHAIIRNEGGPTGQPQYRCGKVGPCATVDITLRSISKILPSNLNFNPNLVNGGPSSFGTNIFESSVEKSPATSPEKLEELFESPQQFGSFVGDVLTDTPTSLPPKSQQDLAWDPNGEFWWDMFMEEDEEELAMQITHRSQYSLPEPSEREMDGMMASVSSPAVRAESFMEAIATIRENEKKRGVAEKIIGRAAEATEGEAGEDKRGEGDEMKNVKIQLQLYEQKEIETKWNIPLATDSLGGLIRGVTHMLSIKTIYKQLAGQLEDLKVLFGNDLLGEEYLRLVILIRFGFKLPIELLPYSPSALTTLVEPPVLKKQNSVERFKHSANMSPVKADSGKIYQAMARLTSIESLLAPLAQFVSIFERIVMSGLCPALPLDPTAFISPDIAASEALMEQLLHEKIGVPLRHVKLQSTGGVSGVGVVGTSHPALSSTSSGTSGSEHVVECMESGDAMDWICKHTDEATLQAIMHTKSGDVLKPEHVLKWLWDRRILQNIVLDISGVYTTRQHFFRYIDPWEVSIVTDQSTVLSSARLGRGWYGPVSAFSATSLIDTVGRYMRLQNQGKDGGFMKLWESLRAEAWLVMSISTAHEQGEREAGGPIITELTSTALGASDPYHSCLARHLYRNALFSRLCMPHRFVAVLQVDTFALKDLSPQKFMAGVASTPIEVYAILRLVRSTGKWKASEHRRTLADTIVTPARKIEPNKQLVASQPSEYAWREQAVMRFPLPDRVLSIGPFVEGGERNLRQPPRKLQIAVYETRSFFSDTKLGELELPLSVLSDDRPFRDWLPLSSEKGAAWFVHVQMQLRFLLMTKDSNRDSTIRSNKGKSTLIKKEGERSKNPLRGVSNKGDASPSRPSHISNERSPILPPPRSSHRSVSLRSSIASSPIMYSGIGERTSAEAPEPSTSSEGKSRLDELGDFF